MNVECVWEWALICGEYRVDERFGTVRVAKS
jgi:hypothetical protein